MKSDHPLFPKRAPSWACDLEHGRSIAVVRDRVHILDNTGKPVELVISDIESLVERVQALEKKNKRLMNDLINKRGPTAEATFVMTLRDVKNFTPAQSFFRAELWPMMTEGFHAGLRKGCDSKTSSVAWRALYDLSEDDWKGIYWFMQEYISATIQKFIDEGRKE